MIVLVDSATSSITDPRPLPALIEAERSRAREDSIAFQADDAWRAFLFQLEEPQGMCTAEHVQAVRNLWEELRRTFPKSLELPLTQVTPGGAIQLAWDMNRRYFEVNVNANGTLEWFYRDRHTNELAGTEDIADGAVSSEFVRFLRRTLA